jgi:hypothetical protein
VFGALSALKMSILFCLIVRPCRLSLNQILGFLSPKHKTQSLLPAPLSVRPSISFFSLASNWKYNFEYIYIYIYIYISFCNTRKFVPVLDIKYSFWICVMLPAMFYFVDANVQLVCCCGPIATKVQVETIWEQKILFYFPSAYERLCFVCANAVLCHCFLLLLFLIVSYVQVLRD